jgi:hypothetical protein
MHSLRLYLRARDAAAQRTNSAFSQPLLNNTIEQNSHDDETASTDDSSGPNKKVMIRIKSSSTDSSFDDDEVVATQEEDPLSCIQNHRWLSPSKPSARALIYLLYAADLAVGSALIADAFSQKQSNSDDYGYIMSRLTSGLLLLGGSLAGICLHTPVGKLLCGGEASRNKSLMIFSTSFAFIAVGIYYMVSI